MPSHEPRCWPRFRELPDLIANHNCNATSAVQISHLFVRRMVGGTAECPSHNLVAGHPPAPALLQPQVSKKLPGCVVFTSSAAAAAPSPFSVLYAATKSFLASFGAGLAAEVLGEGVLVSGPGSREVKVKPLPVEWSRRRSWERHVLWGEASVLSGQCVCS